MRETYMPPGRDFESPADGVVVVSATRAEARYVPAGTRLLITGIGKVRASMMLARELASGNPADEVIAIGTAGALRDGFDGLYTPSTILEHDISSTELRAMGYEMVDQWDLPTGDGTVLASGDTFVADPQRRAQLARVADLVDMEACAFAHVCAEFGVPLRVVKVVTDGAGEDALEWPERVDAAARRLGSWLTEHVPARLR